MLDGDDLFRSSDEIIGKEAAPAFARRAVFAGERVNFGFEDDPAPIFERADFLRDGEIGELARFGGTTAGALMSRFVCAVGVPFRAVTHSNSFKIQFAPGEPVIWSNWLHLALAIPFFRFRHAARFKSQRA